MKNGTVFLIAYKSTDKWIYKIIGKVIDFVTKSPYVHTGLYLDGKYYDDTIYIDSKGVHSGLRVSDTREFSDDVVLQYTGKLTPDQILLMRGFLLFYAKKHIPYSILRLVSLLFVYPTRWFWNWIGYVPMEHSIREVCSTIMDDAYAFADIDLFPEYRPELIAPGDFLNSKLLKRVSRSVKKRSKVSKSSE